MSLLVQSEIQGLFVYWLTSGDKYSLHNREESVPPIEVILSKKQKALVNMLRNSPKISDITKRDIIQLHFFQNDRKILCNATMQISVVFGTL